MGQRHSQESLAEIQSWFNWDTSIEYFPRFREVTVYPDEPLVVIRTRTGGGNREEYASANADLCQLEGFTYDEDDDFDSTFAYWHYAIPERSRDAWKAYCERRDAAIEAEKNKSDTTTGD